MITATPNSVRWDHVNRVTYRFQALNFQSDVLEALVLNSPPLTRKSRRKPVVRIPVDQRNISQNKIDFVKSKHMSKRSFSFDDGFTDLNDETTSEATELDKCRSNRISSYGYVANHNLQGHFVAARGASCIADPKHTRNGFVATMEQHNDGFTQQCEDEDLESKSKEYLINLVKVLRSQVSIENKSHVPSKMNSERRTETPSNVCCYCKQQLKEKTQDVTNTVLQEGEEIKETLFSQMKQLETEVQRTRKIAKMFENELSCLKDKFSAVLVRSSKPQNGEEVTPAKTETRQVVNCDSPQQTSIYLNSHKEWESSALPNSEANMSCLDDVNQNGVEVISAETEARQVVNCDSPQQTSIYLNSHKEWESNALPNSGANMSCLDDVNQNGVEVISAETEARQVVNCDSPQQTSIYLNSHKERESCILSNSGANISCLDDVKTKRTCDIVSALG